MKLEVVHIILIGIGALVYINGMFVAIGLGIILYKKARDHDNIGKCTMYSTICIS